MKWEDCGQEFESIYAVPVTNSAPLAARLDSQASHPTDLTIVVEDDGRGAAPGWPALPHIPTAPALNVFSHSSAPYAMNPMALEVEATILAQGSPWEWIPDTPIGHRGFTGIVVVQAPEIDPYTQGMMPEPREGYRGVFPFSSFTQIPFPNAWE